MCVSDLKKIIPFGDLVCFFLSEAATCETKAFTQRNPKFVFAGKQAAGAETAHQRSHLGELTWSHFIHLETTKMLRL